MLIILEAYIQLDGPYELNLSDAIRSRVLKAVASGDYHPQVLDQAKDSITDLMKSSSYPSFLESASSKNIETAPSPSSPVPVFKREDSDRDRNSWRKAMEQLKLLPRAMKKQTPS
ncbi:hypothetical protein BGZ58_006474 [Dissophora ornata]|nr:hypothetical protein BGZ58_006474 [Dissophora ornata]